MRSATFGPTWFDIEKQFLLEGDHQKVDTGHWQGVKGTPHSQTREIQNALIEVPIEKSIEDWQSFMHPNLPWAEDHFLERVSGEPLNPGVEYQNWPWYKGGVEDHKETGQFSHTYMERFWPRFAGDGSPDAERFAGENFGIRFRYADLNDLVQLLAEHPYTRQAYLPIWFPEDGAASLQGERVPCTLGYHFMLRNGQLHCFYPMRSVDFVRYLRDDIYMAGRLALWLCEKVPGFFQRGITPGKLTFFASSLHIFEGDVPKLQREYDEHQAEKLRRAFG
jgi:hypothetical protein